MLVLPEPLKSVWWLDVQWSGIYPPDKYTDKVFKFLVFVPSYRNEQNGERREEDTGGLSCPNQLAQDLLGGDILNVFLFLL